MIRINNFKHFDAIFEGKFQTFSQKVKQLLVFLQEFHVSSLAKLDL